jgi:hypothetical protein
MLGSQGAILLMETATEQMKTLVLSHTKGGDAGSQYIKTKRTPGKSSTPNPTVTRSKWYPL